MYDMYMKTHVHKICCHNLDCSQVVQRRSGLATNSVIAKEKLLCCLTKFYPSTSGREIFGVVSEGM
jgi:hypothetical protein